MPKLYYIRVNKLAVAIIALTLGVPAYTASEPSLAEQAFAIISETCLRCHGPERVRGGLRLDSLDDALLGGDSGVPAFVRGNSAVSQLVQRLVSTDEDERMPQKRPPLDSEEIAIIKAWIDGGAEWTATETTQSTSTHWAFQKPSRPETRPLADPWIRNPIDAFILERIHAEQLPPTPEADRETLIRRLSLDLIGLPPTLEELDAFLEDGAPDAYDRLVERLLASPHYGERQARHWLDAARYADTNGYEKDRPRSIWPYRDWVIDAFNGDMPFDQFVVEQMAGDLLPNATAAQRIATGFHRNTMLNEEGGIDAEEDRYIRTVDRVNTTGTVFLGLTVACAQCHSHKYDPISQREYFQLYAFLNTTVEPELRVPSDAIAAKRATRTERIERIEDLALWAGDHNSEIERNYDAWKEEVRDRSTPWRIVRPSRVESEKFATMNLLDDASVLATGDIPNDDTYTIEFETNGKPVTALRLEVLPHESLPGGGPGRGVILAEGDFLLTEIAIEAGGNEVPIATATEDYAPEDYGAALALDGKADTGWSVKERLGEPHAAVFAFETPVDAQRFSIRLEQDYIHQHTIGRFRISVTSAEGAVASGVPAEIEAAVLANDDAIAKPYYVLNAAPALEAPHKRLDELRGDMPEFATTLVLAERAEPRIARIHHRGEFLEPRDAVTAGVPNVLHDFPDDLPENRLGLAQWLVSEKNPLIARVTMNRLWQHYFGRGLVATPEDFGTRGELPTHPELLDWLAVEFMHRGWSLKDMTRLIVTSATYRQSSHVSPETFERDPENLWLARAPRLRVDAEIVRDIALAASGLLNPEIGGPSVYPPQPDGITALSYGSPEWPESHGADRFRRGLYTYWKRTAPYAMAMTFDAPTGEETCVRRRRTNTPLQALTMMNDPVFVEASQALARRLLDEGPRRFERRVYYLYRLVLSRDPRPEELGRIAEYLDSIAPKIKNDSTDIAAIAGLDPRNPFMPTASEELAAWTLVCRAILNLDETITRE